jgi:hypothetical protein
MFKYLYIIAKINIYILIYTIFKSDFKEMYWFGGTNITFLDIFASQPLLF